MESKLAPLYGFKEQFTFTPLINNKENLKVRNHIVVCGMGGSAISVSLLSLIFPEITVTLHNTYGLPTSYDKENTLFILNSYSGNT
jgi:glucose-6-phosphate isomerase